MPIVYKKFIILILFVSGLTIKAQTTISSIKPNTVCHQFLSLDSLYFQSGASGPNCIWNFQNINSLDSFELHYIDVKQTPYYQYFPEANLAMSSDFLLFNYFKFDSSGYYELGQMGYNADKNNGEYSKYKSPAIVLQYPLQYGDSFQSKDYKIQDFCKYTFSNDINTQKKIDGYGTLILNKDTFLNTLRIVEVSNQIDSIFTYGKSKSLIVQKSTLAYQWFSNTINAPLLTLQKNTRIMNKDTVVYMNNSMYSKGLPQADAFKQFSPILIDNQSANTYDIQFIADNNNDAITVELFQLNYPKPFRQFDFEPTSTKSNRTISIAKDAISKSTPTGQVIELRIKSQHLNKSLYLMTK